MKIGILAIQGSVIEHKRALERAADSLNKQIEIKEVKHAEDLVGISGIILPGGESTTQSKLLKRFGLFEPLKQKISEGLPTWGTCAGAILLAKNITGKNLPETFAIMDITAGRNAYGAQLASCIEQIEVNFPHNQHPNHTQSVTIEAIFIRAPKLQATSEAAQVLATHDQNEVLLQQDNMLVSSFHPELTEDAKVHEYFLEMCSK